MINSGDAVISVPKNHQAYLELSAIQLVKRTCNLTVNYMKRYVKLTGNVSCALLSCRFFC